MPFCKICGEEYPPEEMTDEGICLNCASSMMQKDGIDMGLGDEFI
ncbi:MAG: hypothetical protein V5A68_02450 [Candidatus Thermoplasmatota archaeon]